MNGWPRRFVWIPVVLCAGAVALAAAGEGRRAGEGRKARNRPVAAPEARAEVAYLGLAVAPVPEVLRAHLDLPEGAGTLVTQVDPEGAAVGVISPNDILFKVDDQFIVNQEQLAVVVRMHKPGDEVELTMIKRGGKRETAKVKLLSRRAEPLAPIDPDIPDPRSLMPPNFPGFNMPMPMPVQPQIPHINIQRGGGQPGANVQMHTSTQFHISKATKEGRFSYEMKDGRKQFRATDPDGKVLFDGPVNTPEERAKVPKQLKESLDDMEENLPDVRIFGPGGPSAPKDEDAGGAVELDPDSGPAQPL